MNTIASHPALTAGLLAAVPLWIHQLNEHHPDTRDRIRARWAEAAADAVAYGGDTLQFGGKRGEAAKVFNHLARGLAAAAYNPGGITAFGEHWCVNHTECVAAEREAADRPSPVDANPDGNEPIPPTYQGRPVVELNLPGLL